MKRTMEIPFINVRNLVIFPHMRQGLFIGRRQTIAALKFALASKSKEILVVSQRRGEVDEPKRLRDMYTTGTICSVEGSVLLQDGTMKVVLTGKEIFKVNKILQRDEVQIASGYAVQAKEKSELINQATKRNLLELVVRAKPLVAFDEDAEWFQALRLEKRTSGVIGIVQTAFNYNGLAAPVETKKFGKSTPSNIEKKKINSRMKMQQAILEESNQNKKMNLIAQYLKAEIKDAATIL